MVTELEHDDTGSRAPSPAVDRAVMVLGYLAEHSRRATSSSEIARGIGLPKSSVNNICLTLESNEMIERTSGGYRLGPRLVEYAGKYLATIDPVREFYRAVERSPLLAQETCRLAVLRGTDVMYLACANGTQPLRLHTNVGDRLPASATATGKALLSLMENRGVSDLYADVSSLPALTDRSPRTLSELIDAVATVKRHGYATDDQETTPGVSCLGIAFVSEDRIAYGISVTVLSVRWDEALIARFLPELRAVAVRLSRRLRPGDERAPLQS